MKNKTVEIPSSLMWWVFGVHEVTQQKNQLHNLGWDKQRFGQTLIDGLTTFAHKLSTAISRKVVGKKVHSTIPKGNVGYDKYTVPDTVAVEPAFAAFP